MSIRRAEFIAFLFLAVLAVLLGFLSFEMLDKIDKTNKIEEIAKIQNWATFFLNLSTGLIGTIVLYVIFKLLFGLESDENGSRTVSQPNDLSWKEPLKGAILLLAKSGKIDSDSIGVFRRYKLSNNIELLNGEEIRELRAQIEQGTKK